MIERIEADVVVAGGGMGGLMAATYAHRTGARVVLLAGVPGASIRMAGFATALLDGPEDRPERLFNDMFIAGGFINHPRLLAAIVERIGPETRFFEQLGVPFHRTEGRLARRQAAGVSWPRAVFTLDMVGEDAGRRLTERLRAAGAPPVWVLDRTFLLDLDCREGEIRGALAYVRPEKRWVHIQAPAVVLATGGAGRLYRKTTNFAGSTGMGYALALEAGAPLVDMEFVSFEPTVAVGPPSIAEMEVPTMAFSEGARLLNGRGEPFMTTMPPPSKDVMSRAMLREIVEGRGTPYGGVYYDLREMPPETAMELHADPPRAQGLERRVRRSPHRGGPHAALPDGRRPDRRAAPPRMSRDSSRWARSPAARTGRIAWRPAAGQRSSPQAPSPARAQRAMLWAGRQRRAVFPSGLQPSCWTTPWILRIPPASGRSGLPWSKAAACCGTASGSNGPSASSTVSWRICSGSAG